MKGGIYILKLPHIENGYKIGCSIDIGSCINGSPYTTEFLSTDPVTYVSSFWLTQFSKFDEFCHYKKIVHERLTDNRIEPNREIFRFETNEIAAKSVRDIIDSIGIEYTELIEKPSSNTNYSASKDITKYIDFPTNDRFEPRDYQQPIIDNMKTFFAENTKGILNLPCGYGKMFISLFYLKHILKKVDNAVIYVPHLILNDQFYEKAQLVLGHFIANIIQYCCYVDKQESEKEILNSKKWVVICNYDSSKQLNEFLEANKIGVSFSIYDEAHRTCVQTEDSNYANMVHYSSKQKLFMTATTKIIETNGKKDVTYSMDNVDIYGPIIERVTMEEAIDAGRICDYKFCFVEGDNVKIIQNCIEILKCKHILVYHNSRESSEAFCKQLYDIGIKAFYIDGTMQQKKRMEILKDYEESDISVLCNVNVLQEGISLDFIDTVFFAEPRRSAINIIQSCGRCMRLYPGKHIANIVIPYECSNYMSILKMMTINVPIKKSRNKIGCNIGKKNKQNKHIKIVNIDNFHMKILSRKGGIWKFKYLLSIDYENKYGIIKDDTIYKGINIGKWISRQKTLYNKKKLTNERFKKLNHLKTWRSWVTLMKIRKERDYILNICFYYEIYVGDIKYNTVYQNIKLGQCIIPINKNDEVQ
jgi:superfamily II DNA or RNA helicase